MILGLIEMNEQYETKIKLGEETKLEETKEHSPYPQLLYCLGFYLGDISLLTSCRPSLSHQWKLLLTLPKDHSNGYVVASLCLPKLMKREILTYQDTILTLKIRSGKTKDASILKEQKRASFPGKYEKWRDISPHTLKSHGNFKLIRLLCNIL